MDNHHGHQWGNFIIDFYKHIFGCGSSLFSSAVSIAMIVVGICRCINK